MLRNSGKQRWILTKFYTNTVRLHSKQVTKFQQNQSTSARATACLVRSLKSISVHYRHRRDWLSSVRTCEWQDFSTSKVCVHNVCSKSNAISKTWTPLPDHFIDDHLVEMFPLFDQARLQLVMWLRYTRSYSFHQIWQSTGLRSGLLAGYRDGVMKSGVSWVNKCTVLCALWAGRLSAWLQYVTLYWKPKYFVVKIWILITCVINNIFLWNLPILSHIHS